MLRRKKTSTPPDGETTIPDKPTDETLVALMKAYQKYRYVVLSLGTCCIALLATAMALYKGGIIDGEVQFAMILGSYLFIGAILFIVFARVRPIKADIRLWNKALDQVEKPQDDTKKKHPPVVPESLDKASKHPPTPEYRRIRRLWKTLIVIAVLIMFMAMALIRINQTDMITPIVVLTSSYVFLFIAVYLETKKLKPLRNEWKKRQKKTKGSSASKRSR